MVLFLAWLFGGDDDEYSTSSSGYGGSTISSGYGSSETSHPYANSFGGGSGGKSKDFNI